MPRPRNRHRGLSNCHFPDLQAQAIYLTPQSSIFPPALRSCLYFTGFLPLFNRFLRCQYPQTFRSLDAFILCLLIMLRAVKPRSIKSRKRFYLCFHVRPLYSHCISIPPGQHLEPRTSLLCLPASPRSYFSFDGRPPNLLSIPCLFCLLLCPLFHYSSIPSFRHLVTIKSDQRAHPHPTFLDGLTAGFFLR